MPSRCFQLIIMSVFLLVASAAMVSGAQSVDDEIHTIIRTIGRTGSLDAYKDRLNELGFYFPLRSISAKKLGDIFSRCPAPEISAFPERIERLEFLPVRGVMKGFIDMVFRHQGRFYIVDWKSNFLGNNYENYDQDALRAAMEDAFYILQYHIYIVALNQYLRLRLPDYDYNAHFGGAYYIFVRGVEPEKGPDFGVYRDRPSGELIRELGTELIGD